MKFFLISDNKDTYMGMRLAGIDGVVVHTTEEVEAALAKAVEDPQLGLLLITEKLVALCPGTIAERKLHYKRPLIVEIPDRHGSDHIANALEKYISESIGIRM